mmetsp:Transcript_86404/g.241721  ORF Transcript_86404/g.241721 Transcript_86404/m.241721 type:complete len:205 (+) Transcript_86404:862-1476(+)
MEWFANPRASATRLSIGVAMPAGTGTSGGPRSSSSNGPTVGAVEAVVQPQMLVQPTQTLLAPPPTLPLSTLNFRPVLPGLWLPALVGRLPGRLTGLLTGRLAGRLLGRLLGRASTGAAPGGATGTGADRCIGPGGLPFGRHVKLAPSPKLPLPPRSGLDEHVDHCCGDAARAPVAASRLAVKAPLSEAAAAPLPATARAIPPTS